MGEEISMKSLVYCGKDLFFFGPLTTICYSGNLGLKIIEVVGRQDYFNSI